MTSQVECKRRQTTCNLTLHLRSVIFTLFVLSIAIKMSTGATIDIKCISSDRHVCEIDPAICPELTDENTSEQNVNILNFGAFKGAYTFDILTQTRLTKVPTFILKKFKKLSSIRINDAGIAVLTPESFANGENIELLDLRRNQIAEIPVAVFASMANLEDLNLYDNKIDRIADQAFSGLVNLKQLYLGGNQLAAIGRQTFAGAENVQQLFLDDNAIRSIESGAFDMPNLENIVLSDNRLKLLPDDLFAQATMLEKADLSKNDLTRLGRVFDHCSNLYSLSISDNPNVEDVDLFDIMQRLPGLSYLYLANTKLKLPAEAPQRNETRFSLTHLNLANNRLTDPNILKLLQPFESLKTLELQQNQLTRLELIENIKTIFPRLSSIDLQFNDLDTDWLSRVKPIFEAAQIQLLV